MFDPSHINYLDIYPGFIAHTKPSQSACHLTSHFRSNTLDLLPDFNSSDGLAGAAINNRKYILTSPNSEAMPSPPLSDRFVTLNHHLRFGEDDPLEWPQLFHPELPYLACFPLPPERDDDPLSIMWVAPQYGDFDNEAELFVGINQLKYSKFCQLIPHIRALQNWCYTRALDAMPLIPRLLSILDNFLDKVEFNQNKQRTMYLCIRETQRAYLELQAYIDYLKVFKPRMDSGVKGSQFAIAAHVRGAFTFDPAVCERLYNARIPVWLIRPSSELGNIRVKLGKKASLCIPPLSGMPPLYPPHRPIFVGPEYSLDKYKALENHVLSLQGPNCHGTFLVCPFKPEEAFWN